MIPLTVRSYYSLMWGTASPEKLVKRAKQLGYDRMALTDTDNLYGLWPFLSACREEGISPIVGAELTEPGSDLRAVCLVENREGYKNLCRLITARHTAENFSLKTALSAHAVGVPLERAIGDAHLCLVHFHCVEPGKRTGNLGDPAAVGDTGIPTFSSPGLFDRFGTKRSTGTHG